MKTLELNIDDYATKERKLCENEYFRWSHDYPFVRIVCTNIGILLEGTYNSNVGHDGGMILRKNQGRVLIPKAIREAYNLTKETIFQVARLSENQWLLLLSPVKNPILPMQSRKNIKYNEETAIKVGYAKMHYKKISLNDCIAQIPFEDVRITLHLGDCFRIDIQEEIGRKNETLTLDNMRDYYGKHLQGFVGDEITFSQNLVENASIPFCQTFLDKINVPYGTVLELYKSTDDRGRIMFSIAPMDIPDMITGETIDVKKEMPEPVAVCEDCNQNMGNIRIIANEFLKLAQTFQEFATKYDTISSENERISEENEILKKKLQAAENKNAAILELLKS